MQFFRLIVAGTLSGLLLGLVPASALTAQTAADARLEIHDRWRIGGAGGWDYLTLDASGKRLFLSRGTRVDVLDTGSGKRVGTIPNTMGVHGIALADDLRRGYTSNGRADTVTEFDLDTLKTVREAPVSGHNPDAILYESTGRHVFTFNGRSKNLTVLDASSLAIVATLPLPDKPEFAVTDGDGNVFVNIESEAGQMVVIDARTLSVKAHWTLPGCASPSGLALDNAQHRLFSVCDGKIMAITNAATGEQIARIPIGAGPDAAAFDSRRGLAFSSNGEGTLTVVRQEAANRYGIAYTLATEGGARTMALDTNSGKIYLVGADFDPPPPATSEQPHRRPIARPETFTVLVARYP
jgi:hypothetical protein